MTTEYILEQRILGPRLQVQISHARYEELAQSRKVLSQALSFEQRYELVLGNFISMELAFTEISLRAALEPRFGYSDSAATLENANRHVVNFLTALRGYVDQVPQDFTCLDLEPDFGEMARVELEKSFSRSPEYRFMYTLRNHVQHRAAAIHGFESDAAPTGDANAWVEAVKLYANKASLAEDRDFKARVLAEQPDRIDVRGCARRSMQELGEVHVALRKASADHKVSVTARVEPRMQSGGVTVGKRNVRLG